MSIAVHEAVDNFWNVALLLQLVPSSGLKDYRPTTCTVSSGIFNMYICKKLILGFHRVIACIRYEQFYSLCQKPRQSAPWKFGLVATGAWRPDTYLAYPEKQEPFLIHTANIDIESLAPCRSSSRTALRGLRRLGEAWKKVSVGLALAQPWLSGSVPESWRLTKLMHLGSPVDEIFLQVIQTGQPRVDRLRDLRYYSGDQWQFALEIDLWGWVLQRNFLRHCLLVLLIKICLQRPCYEEVSVQRMCAMR